MKKIKNKFILVIILFIVSILAVESYKTFILWWADRNSYVILIDWEATLNNFNLEKDKKELLKSTDEIKTIWEKSLAMVKWWDWSITRIWGNSFLKIDESEIEQDLLNIKISFRLEEWKTWSDVISFIWEDSYFHQTFADTTAAVRGTTFEVNLDKDYVYVHKHEVKLTKETWEKQIITENKPFDLKYFSFFKDLNKFVSTIKDNAWQSLNIKLDKEFYKTLLKTLDEVGDLKVEIIDDVTSLTVEKKQELYNKALIEYQKLNFVKTNDTLNYSKKLELKKSLITLSWEGDKQNLIITTLYDLKDLASNKQIIELKEVIWILWDNKDILPNLDINLSDYIDLNILENIKIPEGLKDQFINDFDKIKNTLNLGDMDLGDNNIVNWIKDWAQKSIDDITNTIGDFKDLIK